MSGQSSPAAPPYYDGQEHANGTSTSSTASPRDTSPQLHSSPASSVSSTRDTWRRPTRGRTVDSLDSLDEQDEHGPEATYSSTQPLLPRQTNGSSSPSSPLFPRRTSNEYPGNAGSERTDSPLSRPDDSSAEVIGFHPVSFSLAATTIKAYGVLGRPNDQTRSSRPSTLQRRPNARSLVHHPLW